MQNNQVIILIGATGSGKSTQTLPFLVDAGILDQLSTRDLMARSRISGVTGGVVTCTQPRKVAAISLADYVASEWREGVGEAVGVKCEGSDLVRREKTKRLPISFHEESMNLNTDTHKHYKYT